ncbi:hypothetical protein DFH06DRAFT_1326381 [Mycena polygramma]|nr:hypothetical protein DFH06DRAFT_1326381 [Mycena polygramma]
MLLHLFLLVLAPIRSNAAPQSLFNSTASSQYLENTITARFMNQKFADMAATDSCAGNGRSRVRITLQLRYILYYAPVLIIV